MPSHKNRAVGGKLLGHCAGLLRIALIVAGLQLQLLAENASLGVDVGDRRAGPGQELRPEGGLLAGHGAGDRNDDFGLGEGRCGQSGCEERQNLLE